MQFVYFLDFLKGQLLTLTSSIGDTESTLLNQVEEHWQLIELCHDVNELLPKRPVSNIDKLYWRHRVHSFESGGGALATGRTVPRCQRAVFQTIVVWDVQVVLDPDGGLFLRNL
ncbi:unnamed protein product [Nezara viridula]|uniref:Uncharacterized protein n=1 Tax=Nezara viridula TaxID=85310 RepID=A0A9P0MP80_NEZVI|nr:unnamed protein product [Nezara viridula]